MATLGLIGSGYIGGTLARLAVAAGLDVVLSNSRGPETLASLVEELGPRARAATPAEAGAAGDWVVVTVPLGVYLKVPVEPLAGKVVLDTNNYYPERDGKIPELDEGSATSSELLQRHLPDSKVVKAFNNIYYKHLLSLARPAGSPDRSALLIAGDDPEATASATALLDTLGFDAVNTGTLAESWRFQPGTPAYGVPYLKDPQNVTNLDADPGVPTDATTLRTALSAATRPTT
ncbi:NADPH-dependent F420 reductase [Sphaerisporangium corydalis]|uniref:NADPH-dependent F420 reductase n=1 Tax=Sphaerisporangium corydalis TaxID=1441875 RepID=A0ABV9E5P1_9ACTN|nr:NAD(P)-binding domain-containing protein [Sphaerisporangium corydalis]